MTRFVLHFVSTLAFVAAIASPPAALASSRIVADDVLARASAAAVHGRVAAVESSWDPAVGTIYTFVTLDVVQSWHLPGAPLRIVVKQLGGVVNDTAFVVGGQARFEPGEEVFLFLDVRPRDRTLSVAGLENGKWTLTDSTDAATAMAREVRGTDRSQVVSRDFKSVAQLQALAALTGGRASAASVDLAPRATNEEGRAALAWTLLTPETPARWHQADSGAPVFVDTETGGHPQFGGGGLTQLARAAQMWATAGSLPLREGGSRGPRCFNNGEPSDGRISLTYGDPCGEIADESWTLAIGGAYYSSSDVRTVNGTSFWQITKGMIVTDNPPWKWSGMSTGCYEELVAHELGHAIGFGHASDRPAVMYPAITADCGSRSRSIPLSSDDLAGMAFVYPLGVANDPPPNSPTGLGTTVSGSTVTIRWTAPVGGTAPTGYRIYAGTAAGLSNIGSASVSGTSIVVPGVPDGIYYLRVVAVSPGGNSTPTPDHLVNVNIGPPGVPQNVIGTVGAGGNVHISWQPSATGGAPAGYYVQAGYSPGAPTHQAPVTSTSLAVANVPPGTYYVRIVAVNVAGVSAPSTELTLVVH